MNGWIRDRDKTPMFGLDRSVVPHRWLHLPPAPWRMRLWGVWWLLREIWPTLRGRR